MDRAPEPIGVVIRTLNEEAMVGACLDALERQRTHLELDVLVVDSGSTDATLEIVRSRGARVFELPPGDFDYSKSLNDGIARVGGDLVLLLSAHAVPVDETWVERMAAPFANPRVAGVASRQVPWDDAPWREVLRLQRQFDAPDATVFSNAASCIRRSVWREQPFTLPAAEDLEWAERVVAAGWSVVYEPEAAVYHSHSEGPRAQAQRLIDINRVEQSGAATNGPWRRLRAAGRLLYRDGRSILGLDEPRGRKLRHLAELVQMVFYYLVDFSRSGTTAERRRART